MKIEMLLFEAVKQSSFDNFFVVRNKMAIDLGGSRPAKLQPIADTNNKFAIVIEDRERKSNRVIFFTGSRSNAVMRSKSLANSARDKVIILGRLIGRIARGRVFKDITGFRFVEADERNGYLSGSHEHPHMQNGIHRHKLLPEGGGHLHSEDAQLTLGLGGGHFHRENDPIEGFHLNLVEDDGSHQHILALADEKPELLQWLNDVISAHFPVHKWLSGHKRTFIQHIGRDSHRFEATRENWMDHFLWNHSAGMNLFRHDKIFIDPEAQFIRKWYEFEDGNIRLVTIEDFEKEQIWFEENLPFPDSLFD